MSSVNKGTGNRGNMNRGANSLSVTKQQVRKRYNLCSLQFFSFAFVWHFRNFSVVGDKKKFLKKFSQNFGKIALCGVVGIERKSSGFGKLPNKQKSPAVGRQKTDDFTERVPLSYACSETYHFNKHRKGGKGIGVGVNYWNGLKTAKFQH